MVQDRIGLAEFGKKDRARTERNKLYFLLNRLDVMKSQREDGVKAIEAIALDDRTELGGYARSNLSAA